MTMRFLTLLALLATASIASAQIGSLKKHKDERAGFSIKFPGKWNGVPPQPDELDTLGKWSSPRAFKRYTWSMEVMRFHRKGGVTGTGGEEPAADVDFGDLSVAERVKRFRERSRPETFKAYLKRQYRYDLGDPVGEVKVGKEKGKLYAVKSLANNWALLAAVVQEGTTEWAIIFMGGPDDLVDTDKPEKMTKQGRKALSIFKSFSRFTPKATTKVVDTSKMSEVDRKIEEVRRRLPKSWKVVPTPKKQYVVVHNIPSKKTRQLAFVKNISRYLEHIRSKYEVLFPPRKEITAVSVVRVCKDRDEYLAYGAPPSSAGYWSPADEELVIYDASGGPRGGGAADSYATLFHEAFHQYIYYAVGEVSPHSWYNEGYGDYFAGANPKNRFNIEPFDWRVPIVKEAAGQDRLVPLRKLCFYSQGDYYRNASLCYAQGWAFIYFLNHSRDARQHDVWKKILDTYFDTLVETGEKKKAVDGTFGQFSEADWDELEAAYKKFIRTDFK